MLDMIRSTAEVICREKEILTTDRKNFEIQVRALCHYLLCVRKCCLPSLAENRNWVHKDDDNFDFERHLLAPAALMNCVPLVKRLLDKGFDPTETGWLWSSALAAAAFQQNHEILELFISPEVPGKLAGKKFRAFSGANRWGIGMSDLNLGTFEVILDPKWGYVSPSSLWLFKGLRMSLRNGNIVLWTEL